MRSHQDFLCSFLAYCSYEKRRATVPDKAKQLDLGINLDDFDATKALNISDVAKLIRGRRGNISNVVARRWASPQVGCVCGDVTLVLPTLKIGGVLLSMPQWVAAFQAARVRLATEVARGKEMVVSKLRTTTQRKRGHEGAMKSLRANGLKV